MFFNFVKALICKIVEKSRLILGRGSFKLRSWYYKNYKMAADRKVRKPETEAIYTEYLKEEQPGCPFCFKGLRPVKMIKKYQYWYIAENNFPYDAMFKISHLLTPYKHQESYWELGEKELEELKEIKKELVGSIYDIVLENLPHEKTQIHFHQHLLTWI
ncbi:MAG: hypothetical protein ACRCZE_03420 [Candidatus Altimarinota bacterium]